MKHSLTFAIGCAMLTASAVVPLTKIVPKAGTLRDISSLRKELPQKAHQLNLRSEAKALPVLFPISSAEEFASYQTIDGNNDGKTWIYENKSACYEGIGTTYADDWLILGPVDLSSPAGSFTLSLEAWKLYQPESYEVCLSANGNIEDAFPIFQTSDIPNSASLVSSDFTIEVPGIYYLMIHANSPSNGLSLYVRNIRIDENAEESFSVPFQLTPAPEEAKFFTVINSNDDTRTWTYDLNNTGFSIECSSTDNSDDWLLLPEINFPEAGNYIFKWEARSWGDPQVMDVYMGQGEDLSQYTHIFNESEVGNAMYGREVVFPVEQPGMHRLAIHTSTPANRYKLIVKNFSVETTELQPASSLPLDISSLPEINNNWVYSPAFKYDPNTRVKISFDISGNPVSVGIANAPQSQAVFQLFNTSENQTGISREINLPASGIRYLAFFSEGISNVSNLSISVVDSEPEGYPLPFSIQPSAEEFLDFKVVNMNEDASTWTYYEPFGAAKYAWSNTDKADDWLILPAVYVEDMDYMIAFSLKARGMAVTLPETFEIWAGQSNQPSEMVKLFDSPEVRTEQFTPYSFSFSPRWTGNTYFAVRVTSEPKMFHLFVRDFEIKKDGRPTTVPAPAQYLAAIAQGEGSQSCMVSFTLPTLSDGGQPLDSEKLLSADVISSQESFTLAGLPGSELSQIIKNGQGEGEISVIVTNEFGSSNPAYVKVYTGVDRPQAVEITSIAADATNRKATLKWELPDVGVEGGFVDLSTVTYNIRHSIGNGSYQNVGSVEGETEFTYSIPDSYPLEMHYFIITASNEAGDSEQGHGSGIMLGKPHTIPATEDFSDGSIALGPIGMSNPDERYILDWYFDNPALGFDEAANLSGKALIAFTETPGPARGRLNLSKFDTRSDNGARLNIRVFNYPHFAPTDIYAEIADGSPIKIGSILPSSEMGWHEYSFPLPTELMNREWIAPYLDFGFTGEYDDEIWMLDRYGIEDYYDNDLEIRAIQTHSLMKADESYDWIVEVSNYSRNHLLFAYPIVRFTNTDGKVAEFPTAGFTDMEEIDPGETLTYSIPVKLGTEMEGEVAYELLFVPEYDDNPDNNLIIGMTEVWQQEEYVIRDLSVDMDGGTPVLEWSAPSTGYGILYVDNLRSWEFGSDIGLFTNYDGDKQPVTAFVGQPFPYMGYPKAWQVFDYEDAGFNFIYAGYLGSAKSLIAFSPSPGYGKADDWLISPEVRGGTPLTFYVRPLHFRYGSETLEIMVSSTGRNPEDFTLLSTYNTEVGEEDKTPYWEEVEVNLPEDTRFFAIRYVSNDIFGVQLDDILYTPAQEDAEELTYSIFCDGYLIAEGVETTYFELDKNAYGSYRVAAEKLYSGLHPLSNTVEIERSGISLNKADEKENTYYDLSGRRIDKPSEPGIYLSIGQKGPQKIIIK